MNILYFVRHGQTAWNDIGRFQGSTDVPLNLLGIEQAEKAALALMDIHFDAIYSSPLNRAQVTAQTIARPHQLTVQVEPRIAEINFGQWEGMTFEEIERKWPGRIKEMYIHPDTVDIPGSETFADAESRTMGFLNELISANDNKTFLIVSHGAAIRTMPDTVDIPGSETFADAESRTMGFLNELISANDNKTFLIVSHGAAIRTMICGLLQIPSETFADAESRTMGFLNELISANDNKTFLIVSHGAAIRTMICGLLQIPLDRAWLFSQGNANITRIEALKDGRNIVRTLNSTAHLSR